MQKQYLLNIESFLGISKCSISLSPGVIGFCGPNGAGKTSVAKALTDILTGSHDVTKIKEGEKRAVLRLEEYEDGELSRSVAKIQTAAGARFDAKGLKPGDTPGNYLSRLIDKVAVNPVYLMGKDPVGYLQQHLDAKAQPDDIRGRSINFDLNNNAFDECAKAARAMEEVRKELNREVKHETALFEEVRRGMPPTPPPAPAEPREAIVARIEAHKSDLAKADTVLKFRQDLEDKMQGCRNLKASILEGVETNKAQIIEEEGRASRIDTDLDKTLDSLRSEYEKAVLNAKHDHENRKKESAARIIQLRNANQDALERIEKGNTIIRDLESKLAVNPAVDVSTVRLAISDEDKRLKEIQEFEEYKAKESRLKEREESLEQAKAAHAVADKTYKYYAYELPKTLLSRAELPIPGLEFRDGELFIDGHPKDYYSEGQLGIIATKLAVAMAKKKGHIAICFDGIECLDEKNRAEFLKIAEESGLCVLYTRVGEPELQHEISVKQAVEITEAGKGSGQ